MRTAQVAQVARLRQMRLDRAKVALARGNQLAAERIATAAAAQEAHAVLAADIAPALLRHLQAAIDLAGTNERYAAFTLAAAADRQTLAEQEVAAIVALRAAEEARLAAEALRKAHVGQLLRMQGMDGLVSRLRAADRRKAEPQEEDLMQEAHSARQHDGGLT